MVKTRSTFVSNSSTSSFLVCITQQDKVYQEVLNVLEETLQNDWHQEDTSIKRIGAENKLEELATIIEEYEYELKETEESLQQINGPPQYWHGTFEGWLEKVKKNKATIQEQLNEILNITEDPPTYYIRVSNSHYYIRAIVNRLIEQDILKILGGLDGTY